MTRREIAAAMLKLSAAAAEAGEERLHVILDRLLLALRALDAPETVLAEVEAARRHRDRLQVRAALLLTARRLW